MDSHGVVVAEAVSNRSGAYVLRLPRPAPYKVRAIRIGFVPSTPKVVDVGEAAVDGVDIILSQRAISLPPVFAVGRDICGLRADGSAIVLQLWEQARAALSATSLSIRSQALDIETIDLRGGEDREGNRAAGVSGPVGEKNLHREIDSVAARQRITSHGFASTPAETLVVKGYARRRTDGRVVFDAPDADALLSDEFAATHCFHAVSGARDHGQWIGIEFSPVPSPNDTLAGIAGTLWVAREGAQLKQLDFTYTNLRYYSSELCDKVRGGCSVIGSSYGAGGSLSFARLPTGEWLINRWLVRTPPEEAVIGNTGKMVRRGANGFEDCHGGPGCFSVNAPIARMVLNLGVVARVWRDGREIYRDEAAMYAMSRIAEKQAGKAAGHLTGVVTDTDGRPLRGVIIATDTPARAAVTDSNGTFSLRNVPAKELTVGAGKPGYGAVAFRLFLIPDSTRHVKLSLESTPRKP